MSDAAIEQITVRNFKCHKDFTADLVSLNILTGSNAAGKSSLIQAILLAYKSWNEYEYRQVSTNDVFGLNLGIPSSIISEEFEDKDLTLSIKTGGTSNTVILSLSDEDDGMFFDITNCEEIAEQKASPNSISSFPLFFLNAERLGPRIISSIKPPKYHSVGNTGENTAFVISELDKQQKLKGFKLPKDLKISELDRFSANCEAWLNVIIPGTELKADVDNEKNIATLRYKNSGEYYFPTATGFGITYALPIVVQALAAALTGSSVLIVENPEAHLHPYSQSQLGKFLAFVSLNGVQVIVETHSEHIVDGCRIQMTRERRCDEIKVMFFEKQGEISSCKKIAVSENGELEEWPKGFFDQKRLDLRELLEIRRCKGSIST